VVVVVAVVCSLVVVLSSGLAAGGSEPHIRRCSGIVSVSPPRLHPRLLFTEPPVMLSSILEVLRRPRSSPDELPPGGIPQLGYSVVWFNYVHFLANGPDRTSYYLIPGIQDVQLPAACLRLLSPSARREYEEEARAGRAGSVTLEAFSSEAQAATMPYTAAAIQAGRTLLAVPNPSNAILAIAGMVPDGVASVTITAANGATATVPVTNNLFLARPPAGALKALAVRWYAPDGSLIKTINDAYPHLWIDLATGGPVQFTVAPPPAVVRAGKRLVAEFERGRTVFAQSGCLACHRIGQAGNRGPGPDLTHIGSELSRSGIEHAIIDPTAPMPSFKHLPPAKLKAVVTFLHELR
jgi:mono/diheme cytochrome c family protein